MSTTYLTNDFYLRLYFPKTSMVIDNVPIVMDSIHYIYHATDRNGGIGSCRVELSIPWDSIYASEHEVTPLGLLLTERDTVFGSVRMVQSQEDEICYFFGYLRPLSDYTVNIQGRQPVKLVIDHVFNKWMDMKIPTGRLYETTEDVGMATWREIPYIDEWKTIINTEFPDSDIDPTGAIRVVCVGFDGQSWFLYYLNSPISLGYLERDMTVKEFFDQEFNGMRLVGQIGTFGSISGFLNLVEFGANLLDDDTEPVILTSDPIDPEDTRDIHPLSVVNNNAYTIHQELEQYDGVKVSFPQVKFHDYDDDDWVLAYDIAKDITVPPRHWFDGVDHDAIVEANITIDDDVHVLRPLNVNAVNMSIDTGDAEDDEVVDAVLTINYTSTAPVLLDNFGGLLRVALWRYGGAGLSDLKVKKDFTIPKGVTSTQKALTWKFSIPVSKAKKVDRIVLTNRSNLFTDRTITVHSIRVEIGAIVDEVKPTFINYDFKNVENGNRLYFSESGEWMTYQVTPPSLRDKVHVQWNQNGLLWWVDNSQGTSTINVSRLKIWLSNVYEETGTQTVTKTLDGTLTAQSKLKEIEMKSPTLSTRVFTDDLDSFIQWILFASSKSSDTIQVHTRMGSVAPVSLATRPIRIEESKYGKISYVGVLDSMDIHLVCSGTTFPITMTIHRTGDILPTPDRESHLTLMEAPVTSPVQMEYCLGPSLTEHPSDTEDWTREIPTPTPSKPYVWMRVTNAHGTYYVRLTGEGGESSDTYSSTITMGAYDSGTVALSLYVNGELSSSETYADIYWMSSAGQWYSSSQSGAFTGTKTFSYTNAQGWQAFIYDDGDAFLSQSSVIAGAKGDKGTKGDSTEVQFALGASLTEHPTTGWSTTQPTPTSSLPYVWRRERTVTED